MARNAATVALSSVMREASWQDPQQLRVGRRSDCIIPALSDLFYEALDDLLTELVSIQSIQELGWRDVPKLQSKVIFGDARDLSSLTHSHVGRKVDAVVTSPPYASALPYIDTDRLSLRAFGLLPDGGQRAAEGRLIGNREITERERHGLEDQITRAIETEQWLPQCLHQILNATIEVASESESGFRKQRTPALLFAYFRDMRIVLSEIAEVVRASGSVAIVVGDNTVAGPQGSSLRVPTSQALTEIGAQVGLSLQDDLSKRLTSYGASETVHQRNAMNSERVLIFKRV